MFPLTPLQRSPTADSGRSGTLIPFEVWGSVQLRCGAGFRWEVGYFSGSGVIVPDIGRNWTG
jgi:hypothetical protein